MEHQANSKNLVEALFVWCILILSMQTHAATTPEISRVSINVATFCDSATDDDGKLSVHGAFDTVFAAQFPADHPSCSLAVRLAFTKEEYKKHAVKVRFLDSNGKAFFDDVETPLEVKAGEPDAAITTRNLIVNIKKLQFPSLGTYYIQLWLDGKVLTTLHLYVRPPTPKQQR